jgi:diaminopimelate epimerase
MQGIGNDYVYIDGFHERVENPARLAVQMSQPHFGVGADGLILVLPSTHADFRMRMFNKDGSEGIMCGNGARCVGRFVYEHGLTDRTAFTLETGGGVRQVNLKLDGERVASVTIDMGPPQMLKVEPNRTLVSMGNPHVVYFVQEDPFYWDLFLQEGARLCAAMDANIEFVQVLSPERMRMRVYERGSGETMGCGTGACAALVAAQTLGYAGRRATLLLAGGDLLVEWRDTDGHVLLTGAAETVFEGEWRVQGDAH